MPFHTTLNLLDLAELALAVHFALEKVDKNMCIILQKLALNMYLQISLIISEFFYPLYQDQMSKKKILIYLLTYLMIMIITEEYKNLAKGTKIVGC